jgi:hypothetical protein
MKVLKSGHDQSARTSLFSSIGYLRDKTELHQAVAAFASHLEPGGVMVIEPWFTPQQGNPGAIFRTSAERDGEHVVRLAFNATDADRHHSIMHKHYLHGVPGAGVSYWTD